MCLCTANSPAKRQYFMLLSHLGFFFQCHMMEDRPSEQFDLKQGQIYLETNSLIMGMWASETVNMGSEQTIQSRLLLCSGGSSETSR